MMDYVIVQYFSFVVTAACFGFLVGWWAQGSGRRGRSDEEQGQP